MTATTTAPARPKRWEWNRFTRDSTQQTVRCLLWTLLEMGGEVNDPNGRSAHRLVGEARKRGYMPAAVHDPFVRKGKTTGSLSQLIYELEKGDYAGTISRVVNGKRTYKIKLMITEDQLPPRPLPVVVKKVEPTKPAPEPVRVITKAEADAAIKPASAPPPPVVPATTNGSEVGQETPLPAGLDIAPPIDEPDIVVPTVPPLVIAEAGAIDLLLEIQQLVMRATIAVATDIGGNDEPRQTDDYDDVTRRLAETLEENNRLRRKCNDQAETLMAKLKEIDALRKALAIAQNNIKVMQDAHAQGADLERKLNRLNGTQRAIASRPEPAIAARR